MQSRSDSNLVIHARRELEIIGEDPETIEGYLKVIQAFADMGHSGGSASIAIPVISHLLQFQPLGNLTDDPAEWMEISDEMSGGEALWQSRRKPDAFSDDGGDTFWSVNDGANMARKFPRYKTDDHTKRERHREAEAPSGVVASADAIEDPTDPQGPEAHQ